MKKYAIPAILLLAGHEVISILALIVATGMFLGDIVTAAKKRKENFLK